MRALAACLTVVLGFGGLVTMAACSDSTTDESGGAAGASGSTAGKGGGSSAGTTSTAGTGGSLECGFLSTACQTCINTDCEDEFDTCTGNGTTACASGVGKLAACACDPSKEDEDCQAAFVDEGGEDARKLAECYALNCQESCQ